jgi:hypothetical protein
MEVRVKGNDNGLLRQRPRENLLIGRPRHPNLTDMRAFVIAVAQKKGCITRNTLVKYDAAVSDAAQAAVVSRAVSSRLAAANASACCRSC